MIKQIIKYNKTVVFSYHTSNNQVYKIFNKMLLDRKYFNFFIIIVYTIESYFCNKIKLTRYLFK